jgi:hypothetical protein
MLVKHQAFHAQVFQLMIEARGNQNLPQTMQLLLPMNILQDNINFIFEPQIKRPITFLEDQILLIIQFLEIIRSLQMKINSPGGADHNIEPLSNPRFLMSDILAAHQ